MLSGSPTPAPRLRTRLAVCLLGVGAVSFTLGWVGDGSVAALLAVAATLAAGLLWVDRRVVVPVDRHLRGRRQVEDELRQTAHEVEDLYNHAPVGFHSLDAAGRILRINDTELAWLGYRREEVLGQPFPDLLTVQGKEVFAAHFEAFKQRGYVRDLECQLRRKDGSTLHALLGAVALCDETGRFVQTRSAFVDITERKKSEKHLAELSARLHAILDAATEVAVIAFDPAGGITLFNAGAERLLGYAAADMVGRSLPECLHVPAEVQAETARRGLGNDSLGALVGGARHGGHEEREWTYVRKDGSRLRAHLVVTAVRGAGGDLAGFLAIATDVTERHRARERLELTMAAAQIGYWERDLLTNQAMWSANVRELLGIAAAGPEETFEGFLSRVLPEDRDRVRAALRAALDDPHGGDTYQAEFRERGDDGVVRWVEERGRVFRDTAGQPVHVMGTVMNVSERYATAEQLRRARDAAEAASRAKGEFLANMSHEIRTPLNGILGMAQLLTQTAVDERQRGYLETLGKSAESLLSLINDILDLSKVEAGRLELEAVPFDVRQSVLDVASLLEAPARNKGLALTCRLDPGLPEAVVGDPSRLRQVLLNLLSNAVKFTSAGEVRVELQIADCRLQIERQEGAASASFNLQSAICNLQFSVCDTGIGIPADRQGRIFEPFSQADPSTARRYGGTGLGLTISARLVERMGGRLAVASDAGKGSTFSFVLALPTAPPAAAPAAAAPPAAVPVDVLVAEDNPVNQQVLTLLLERAGHRVTVAGTGREAVEWLQRRSFDLVLMDVQMPVMDGVRATKLIRQREKAVGGRVPIVAVTANALEAERERCLAAGMDDFLTKPIRAADLLALVGRSVGRPAAAAAGQPGWQAALSDLGFDEVGMRRLARTFAESAPGRLQALRRAVEAGDAAAVQLAAHTLKGAVGVFAASAAEAAERLEAMGRQGDLGGAAEALHDLAGEVDAVLASLAERTR